MMAKFSVLSITFVEAPFDNLFPTSKAPGTLLPF